MPDVIVSGIRVSGNLAFVPLAGGQEAVIDARDIPKIHKHRWTAHRGRTALRVVRFIDTGDGKQMVHMANDLVPGAGAVYLRHRNGNPLDLRRINLVATRRKLWRPKKARKPRAKPAPPFRAICQATGEGFRLVVRAYGQLWQRGYFPTREAAFRDYCACVEKFGPDCI